jgi:AhpD family alkylhydroperoxidase
MSALGSYLAACGLEHSLLELIKIRASQMNGCGFCIDMHTKDARAGGETEQRIYALNAWRETPFFSDRERAALDQVENRVYAFLPDTHRALVFQDLRADAKPPCERCGDKARLVPHEAHPWQGA